jgi:hypothetical protein
MQTKEELDRWYSIPDRWQYFKSEDDALRKRNILGMLPTTYNNALDVGCGECFIAMDLPSQVIHGIEFSDIASSRFPSNVTRVHEPILPYDLVISTGTMYPQYDYKRMYEYIMRNATNHILIGGIKEWLIPQEYGEVINQIEFKYLDFTQLCTLYKVI